MKKSKTLIKYLLTMCLILWSSNAWSTIYYIDATNGNDSSAGTSEAGAWKTISKVNKSLFKAGDSILFKKGEIWREQLILPSSGTETLYITIGSYGTGAKPIIDASKWYTNAAGTGNRNVGKNPDKEWVMLNNGVYMTHAPIINGSQIHGVREDGVWIKKGSSKTELNPGQWCHVWESPNWNLYYYPSSKTPFDHKVESGYYANAIYLEEKSYVIIDGLELSGSNHTNAISPNPLVMANVGIHGGSYLKVINCDLHAAVHQGVRLNSTTHVTIDNNNIYYNNCGPLRVTNNCTNISVTNNKIYNNYSVDTNSFPDDKGGILFGSLNNLHDNLTITRNEIYNNGFVGANDFDSWIYVGCSSGFTVSYNSVHNNIGAVPLAIWGESTNFARNGVIVYNLIYNNVTANKNGYAAVLRGNMDNIVFANNTIANNTINSSSPALYVYASGTGTAMTNIRVHNNILYENKNESFTTHEVGFSGGGKDLTGTTFDNNIYFRSTLTSTIATVSSVSYALDKIKGTERGYWQYDVSLSHVWDANSITTDPLFTSIKDYHIKSTSPAIDSGVSVSIKKDYAGNPVPQGVAPEIGIYEYSSEPKAPDEPKNLVLTNGL